VSLLLLHNPLAYFLLIFFLVCTKLTSSEASSLLHYPSSLKSILFTFRHSWFLPNLSQMHSLYFQTLLISTQALSKAFSLLSNTLDFYPSSLKGILFTFKHSWFLPKISQKHSLYFHTLLISTQSLSNAFSLLSDTLDFYRSSLKSILFTFRHSWFLPKLSQKHSLYFQTLLISTEALSKAFSLLSNTLDFYPSSLKSILFTFKHSW
jgi:uncharacterized protein Usg